ncbi:50S ribosomal protein L31 [bacterium]|nr:50S ribosomal protein L31 [bacterium]MBU1025915.1 50S ribosomal protein L31 [bacterium]
MKKEIHPSMYKITVSCTCGETYDTISTRDSLKVEICSKCHPYFTGKKKILDKGGRVDRFKKRYAQSGGTYKFTDEGKGTPDMEEDTEE